MAETTYEGYVHHALGHLAAMADQPYEACAADLRRAAAIEAAYLRCADGCRDRADGEPECPDRCRRAGHLSV